MRNQKGFTLIEMLIVLFIISILILITVPNVTKHMNSIDDKGCEAYIKMVQGQVESYRIDHKTVPTLTQLINEGYLKENMDKCPNGKGIAIQTDGTVTIINN
ncbi:competence type IV pilus major pilin ComGC [Ureibacillus sp. FSL K6-8385]|uniref:ComG operon protein 3 n=1 Tax=Ureibacillus terrenus TaxID=118246 RepID=A0A540V6B0_9BACL|nr:competence type IV pilus major pilin ComGC [Ureibacillus terrenus]MED3660740.1 competence type IV pilus major pilin ComGC [Ureibacillus terrenus]MED3762927.1 competence type IV pilus major pilin ComGC [Ureibacillus terrenus]TQE92271.1 prepilin-type N-terminal cleavage/methylation domain-containing protein [Ureibacillus terrenus]